MSYKGKKNVYVCENDNHKMVTVDTDDGVTPFLTTCPTCGKVMQSRMYRVDQSLVASHEWYKPTAEQLRKLMATPDTIQHVEKGGLILRPIGVPTVQ